jgi:transposase
MFSYLSPEQRVRKDHPLRAVRAVADEILRNMSPLFEAVQSDVGRPSIAPDKLLRAQLLQMMYLVRSEWLLMEEIDYSILSRWFVGLNLDEAVWAATTFTKNQDRLLEAAVAKEFLAQVVQRARGAGLLSDEHFTVDSGHLEAWASLKSFQAKDKKDAPSLGDSDGATVDFHCEKRSNETHESRTDPDARLARKARGCEVKLSYSGSLLVENRDGLIMNA